MKTTHTFLIVSAIAMILTFKAGSVKYEAKAEQAEAKISIQDKGATFDKIVADLVKDSLSPEYQKIEEVSPQEILGTKTGPCKYKLYSYLVPVTEELRTRYVAVAEDKSCAFFIADTESFNNFISSLNIFLKDDKELVQFAKVFLKMVPAYSGTSVILWEIPETVGSGQETALKEWFNKHPEHKFHPPEINKIAVGYSVEYYSWADNGGSLKYQYFELKENGEILKYEEKALGEKIGPYVYI